MNLSVHFSSKNRTKKINYLVVSIQPASKNTCSKKLNTTSPPFLFDLKLPTHCNLSKQNNHPPEKTKNKKNTSAAWNSSGCFSSRLSLPFPPHLGRKRRNATPIGLFGRLSRELPPPPYHPTQKKGGVGRSDPKKKHKKRLNKKHRVVKLRKD